MPLITDTREQKVRRAFFRGESLCFGQPAYEHAVSVFLGELFDSDLRSGDITAKALHLAQERASARIVAKASGVIAGVDEFSWLLRRGEIEVRPLKRDGDVIANGETLIEMEGQRDQLLAYERVGLNLLQRMSGIATATRELQDRVHARNPNAVIVATRKTPWGLLDKRAVLLGGGGTHRLGLWDAILVKNNHLALLHRQEEQAVVVAVERTWPSRCDAAFIEIEVRSLESALAAAQAFRSMLNGSQQRQASASVDCPCLLLLDNLAPAEIARIVEALRREGLLETVLLEASGNITAANVEEYAASGVDAISLGSLTHSPQALDLCQRL